MVAKKVPEVKPDPPRDPHGDYKRIIRELALRVGKPFADLLDEWDERAAIATWDGGMTVDEANAFAWDLLLKRVSPQEDLL